MMTTRCPCFGVIAGLVGWSPCALAVDTADLSPRLDVPYVSTPHVVAEAMLRIARVGPDDLLYDLGCGDGRIVIGAARDYGARGIGIDIDPLRIAESEANARAAGVAHLVRFVQSDLFATDLTGADVVTMFLLPEVNLKLRPRLLQTLRPGARVVSHAFDMEEWRPDHQEEVGNPPVGSILLWIVPARVAGLWHVRFDDGTEGRLVLRQVFQDISGTLEFGRESVELPTTALSGSDWSVAAGDGSSRQLLSGRFDGDRASGVLDRTPRRKLAWSATRAETRPPAGAIESPAPDNIEKPLASP